MTAMRRGSHESRPSLAAPSGRSDDDLAERTALADVGECRGYLVERERPIDVDADVAGDAQIGERLKVRRSLPHGEYADPAAGEPAGDPADRQDPKQRSDRSADAAVAAAGREGASVGEH